MKLADELRRVLERKEKRSEQGSTRRRVQSTGPFKTQQELIAEVLRLADEAVLKQRQIAAKLKISETKVSRIINHKRG